MEAATIEKRKFTYKDYLKTPEDKRYELIEGELIMTPSPVPYHQWISKNILYELEQFVRERKIGKVFDAPCDVYLDDENVLQPDILFISNEHAGIIGEKNVQGAPDLVIEILSPGTRTKDLATKRKIYAKFGVREYWVVDPDANTVEILTLKDEGYVTSAICRESDRALSPLLPQLRLKLTKIFS